MGSAAAPTTVFSWNLQSKTGEFQRKDSVFRNWVTADGSSGFPAEKDRYHLYVSLACPWAHRTLIIRSFKELQEVISVTVVDWLLTEGGWRFTDKQPETSLDPNEGASRLRELYERTQPGYEGPFTVPVLWDKKNRVIVNNESSEIIRMLNTEFNKFCKTDKGRSLDFYPEELRSQIDEVNAWVYPSINNGVYRCGFAGTQEAYDAAYQLLFQGLDRVSDILSKSDYLVGDRLTEADIRLFTTIVRFDAVYVGHFKCNKKRIVDYPSIQRFLKRLYNMAEIKSTVNMQHIKHHYYESHKSLNPKGIVPNGPELDLDL